MIILNTIISLLHTHLHYSPSYSTFVGDTQYYVNLCGPASECKVTNGPADVSVCSKTDSTVTPIASYNQQTIMAEGTM